jgi:hypothetical protein
MWICFLPLYLRPSQLSSSLPVFITLILDFYFRTTSSFLPSVHTYNHTNYFFLSKKKNKEMKAGNAV